MKQSSKEQRFGRVVIGDHGIRQDRWLGLFGRRFCHAWSDIRAWSSIESVIHHVDTGEDRVHELILELRAGDGIDFVRRKPGDTEYAQIIETMRRYVPGLEGESLLSAVGRAR